MIRLKGLFLGWLLTACVVLFGAQAPFSHFPPGTFQTRNAIDPSPSTGTTLDDTKTGPGLVLSNGKLTVTRPGATDFTTARTLSTVGYVVGSANQKYFEVRFTSMVANAFASFGLYADLAATSSEFYGGDGSWFANGATGVGLQAIAVNDWSGFAVDYALAKFWVKNITAGSGWNNDVLANQNPATGVGGIDMNAGGSVVGVTQYAGIAVPIGSDSADIKFTGFVGTPPGGYSGF